MKSNTMIEHFFHIAKSYIFEPFKKIAKENEVPHAILLNLAEIASSTPFSFEKVVRSCAKKAQTAFTAFAKKGSVTL